MRKELFIFLLLAIAIIILGGCGNEKKYEIRDNIIGEVDSKCQNEGECVVLMSNITEFEWDKMFVFPEFTPIWKIDDVLGVGYGKEPDTDRLIVFMKKGKIVYREEEFVDPENLNKLVVSFPKNKKYIEANPKTAVFIGEKRKVDGMYYYKIKLKDEI